MFIERDRALNKKWENYHQRAKGNDVGSSDSDFSNSSNFTVLEGIFALAYVAVIGWFSITALISGVGNTDAIIVGVASVLFIGVFLYAFRRKYRAWYGFFEVISALILGGLTIARAVQFKSTTFANFLSSPDSLSTLLGFASAIYIVVRGIDNMTEAKKAKIEAINKSKEIDANETKQ